MPSSTITRTGVTMPPQRELVPHAPFLVREFRGSKSGDRRFGFQPSASAVICTVGTRLARRRVVSWACGRHINPGLAEGPVCVMAILRWPQRFAWKGSPDSCRKRVAASWCVGCRRKRRGRAVGSSAGSASGPRRNAGRELARPVSWGASTAGKSKTVQDAEARRERNWCWDWKLEALKAETAPPRIPKDRDRQSDRSQADSRPNAPRPLGILSRFPINCHKPAVSEIESPGRFWKSRSWVHTGNRRAVKRNLSVANSDTASHQS